MSVGLLLFVTLLSPRFFEVKNRRGSFLTVAYSILRFLHRADHKDIVVDFS